MSDETKKDEEVWVNPLLPEGKREYIVDLQITRVSEEDDTWTLKLTTDQIQQVHTALQHSVIENQREMSKLKKQAQRWSETGTDLEKLGVGKNKHLYKALKKENEKLAQLKDTLTDFLFQQKRML
ncbi:hypothetical protein [Tumebacillus flagellatus]|uniref:Uncharacterized protein n=1 Tax=Tumebacillus flagellatus TaxID=1157490 RepID=A0A074LY82_9BACL|nr:hypothetical protein [Tumebacillus flagellatus]KEO85088.1 hypothetical protein EL26_00560 [Tumebacillus flagellatus]